MAAMKIEILHSSSLHPAGRGQIERMVRTVKDMMHKILATRRDLNWEYLPFIVAKVLNNTVCPKTGFSPSQMVFGNVGAVLSFFELENLSLPHYFVRNNRQKVESKTKEILEMTKLATEKLSEVRAVQNERKNQNRVEKEFKEGDYVFTVHHPSVAGAARPLKTRLNPSPFIVIKVFFTTVLLKMLADGFMTMYHKDSIKKYDRTSPLFSTLPQEVKRVLLYKFEELMDQDLLTLLNHDQLETPEGVQLFEENVPLVTNDETNPDPGPSGIQTRPTNATESTEESENVNIQSQIIDSDSDSEDENEGMTLRGGKRVTFRD
jgi:hypothetical protein